MAAEEDSYSNEGKSFTGLGDLWDVITPHATNPLPKAYKYITAGETGGTVVCVDRAGTQATFYVGPGDILKCRPHRILASGTTATPLIGIIE